MNTIMDYAAHWIIGITALVIWGFGKAMGADPSLIAFAAYTLPIIVGHAISKSQMTQPLTIRLPDTSTAVNAPETTTVAPPATHSA